jgi:hypothetical protein
MLEVLWKLVLTLEVVDEHHLVRDLLLLADQGDETSGGGLGVTIHLENHCDDWTWIYEMQRTVRSGWDTPRMPGYICPGRMCCA